MEFTKYFLEKINLENMEFKKYLLEKINFK